MIGTNPLLLILIAYLRRIKKLYFMISTDRLLLVNNFHYRKIMKKFSYCLMIFVNLFYYSILLYFTTRFTIRFTIYFPICFTIILILKTNSRHLNLSQNTIPRHNIPRKKIQHNTSYHITTHNNLPQYTKPYHLKSHNATPYKTKSHHKTPNLTTYYYFCLNVSFSYML